MVLNSINIFEQKVIFGTFTFLIALLFTVFLIPKVNNLGIKYNCIDKPDKRKQHKKIIVRLGGLGIFLGFIFSLTFSIAFSIVFEKYFFDMYPFLIIILGSLLFFIVGISDDFRAKSPFLKLTLQIFIASLMYSFDIRIDSLDLSYLNIGINYLELPNLINYLFTILWIVGITNSINWLDGLDGLASGISVIISIGLIIIFFTYGQFYLALVLISLCGATIGFLRFNFYPAKILMGDGGSYLLGGLLSLVSLKGLNSISYLENDPLEINALPIHLLLFLFFIPILDLIYVTLNRLFNGHSPFYPDRTHIHHRLLQLNFSHRDTVIILYGISQLFSAISLYMSGLESRTIILCFSIIFFVLCIIYCKYEKKDLEFLNRIENKKFNFYI